ncbi:MAG: hypothetical protein HFG55_09080 [Lachnospiraceae bacterium]|nr:hypothetical protein [Lachnospiraceae bacterium]
MKKTMLAMAIFAIMLGTAACSSKKQDVTTTAATTEAASEPVTEEESESAIEDESEEVEEDFMTGEITAVNGDILTVRSDDDDSEKNYDLSQAEVTQEFPFSEGDLVEITFPYETTKDPIPVIALDVLESVIGMNTEPSATGKITEATDTAITMELEDGESYTISIANAYIVAQNGISVGKEATVTYIGELDDEAMATKVIMEDSYDSAEASLNAFVGKVVQKEENNIVLESAEGDFFTFVSDELDFSEYNNGDTLQIFYTGTVTEKEIPAEKIEKK